MSVQQHIHHSGTCIYNVAHVDEFHFLVNTMTHRDAESVFYNDYSYHFFDLNIIDWSNLQVGLVTSSVTSTNCQVRHPTMQTHVIVHSPYFLSRPFKLRRGRCVIRLYMVNSQLIFSRSSDNWFTHICLIFTRGHRISTLLWIYELIG